MAPTSESHATFNLWTEPWIDLECLDGRVERAGLEQTLLRAQEFRSICDHSPLTIVGVHRLLVAILQSALKPTESREIKTLWRTGHMPAKAIKQFGGAYANRFDLFSQEAPFLQSADLSLEPKKGDKAKPVLYLAPEMPAGTAVTHFRHGTDEDQVFCSVCAAKCLATMPAFTTSGGAGLRPSINGVPPIYVLPGGESLFQSLAASLLLPDYQPAVASDPDLAWWERPKPVVSRSKELRRVGYLQSLTFPARRVRLHPTPMTAACSRCGRQTEWGVRTMIFEMGECRPKDAPFWQDPFAAYRPPDGKSRTVPTPIRPVEGRATWREFASLFLQRVSAEVERRPLLFRPRVLDQMAELEIGANLATYPFRCIGLRTDMKAKVFEWVDADMQVPPALLRDETAGYFVGEATEFATACSRVITSVFKNKFSRGKQERHRTLKRRMESEYWSALAAHFRDLVLGSVHPSDRPTARDRWQHAVVREAMSAFSHAAEEVGEDAVSLREHVQGERLVSILLAKKRKEANPND